MTGAVGDDTDADSSGDDHDAADADQVSWSPDGLAAVRRAVSSYTSSRAFGATDLSTAFVESQRRILAITQPFRVLDTALGGNVNRIARIANSAALPRLPEFWAARFSIPTVGSSFPAKNALHRDWFKQIAGSGIDSDVLKTYALTQPNLTNVASALVQNTDFGQGAFAQTLAGWGRSQSDWLGRVADLLTRFQSAWYPPNLRDVEDVSIELVEEVVMVDGISLYGVPSAHVAAALLHADGAAKRREILGRRWKRVSADCRQFTETVADGPLRDYAASTLSALDALDAGNCAAAQALTATVVDSILRNHVAERRQYFPDRAGKRTTATYDELSVRNFIAFAPIWQAYQQFDTDKGDPVPAVFSRHASAHTVSRRQFNRRNAVQGLLLACGLLCLLDERNEVAAA